MHGQFGLLSPGKASMHSTALPSVLFVCCFYFCGQCFRVSIPPGCEACSFTTDENEIFNVRTNLVACVHAAHTKGVGGWGAGTNLNTSAQELTRRDKKTLFLTPFAARISRSTMDVHFVVVVWYTLLSQRGSLPWEIRVAFLRKASCNRVALPNPNYLKCMLGLFVFP